MKPQHPNADVRMQGFAVRSTVEEALSWLASALPQFKNLPTEATPLADAARRVLASDVTSPVNVPQFVRAMMDGFALQAAATHGASTYNRLELRIVGDCFPGQPFAGSVGAGEAVRVMTGAPLPGGADAVLPVESTECEGQQLWALGEVPPGKHVGTVGEDIALGELLLCSGRVLRPQDVGVLSSIGRAEVPVVRPPRVSILLTGNELLPAGTEPTGCHIADANGPMLVALAERDGGVVVRQQIVPDDRSAILAALREEADVVLVSGGSSVGQEDHVPTLLAEHGELAIHGIAMRPSSPMGLGRLDDRLVFLLPGNPVSCLCGYDFFAGRAIRALAGRSLAWPYRQRTAVLTRKLVSTVGRVDYVRVKLARDQCEPLAISGSSILSSTTRADGFVIVPADSEGHPAAAEVDVFLYDESIGA